MPLADEDFQNLLRFRDGLRSFLHWSETQAKAAGLTAAQHQLMLAVRGHAGHDDPTIGDVAGHLLLRHHSAVELVQRAATAGLVERVADAEDQRLTRVRLTAEGRRRLARLSELHLEELRRLSPSMRAIWDGLAPDSGDAAARARTSTARTSTARTARTSTARSKGSAA